MLFLLSSPDASSLKSRITAIAGRPSGFDYLRIILAVSIVCFHSVITSYGPIDDVIFFWNTPAKPFVRLLLPMFFALSGFLVAGSLERSNTLIEFLGLRIIRIYPALTVEVIMSALILGPLLTTYSINDYFMSSLFYSYLFNIIGHIHYLLPGVFENNPYPRYVNGQLWTVPFELACYMFLSILAILGIKRNRFIAPVATLLVIVIFVAAKLVKYNGIFPQFSTALPGPLLIASFLAGVSLYLYSDRVAWDKTLFWISLVSSICMLGFIPFGEYLAPIPIAYLTIYIGLLNPARTFIIRGADYSYGIFLYGFAIQQAVCSEFIWARHWYINIMLCLPLSFGVAAMSWHFVEKPALGLRKHVGGVEHAFRLLRSIQLRS
jgi:peptidoglycan/LPS O-acetylase OafA/YrhL